MGATRDIPDPARRPEITGNLYTSHAVAIDAVIGWICRRHRLAGVDAEDFEGMVRLKFLEDDCAVLRRFQHRSSLQTFLVAVVQRAYLDYRNQSWGRWRPSVKARRLGELAIELERMLSRDGLSMDEAVETLRTRRHPPVDLTALEAIRARLPTRVPRTLVSEDLLERVPSPAPDAESAALHAASRGVIRAASSALEGAVQELEPADRLLVRLRFYDGLTVAEIARLMRVEQKPLYRRLERCLAALRDALVSAGFREGEVSEILRHEDISCD